MVGSIIACNHSSSDPNTTDAGTDIAASPDVTTDARDIEVSGDAEDVTIDSSGDDVRPDGDEPEVDVDEDTPETACDESATECRDDAVYTTGEDCVPGFVANCEFGCQDGACSPAPTCTWRVDPPVGEWTPEFGPNTDCDCNGDLPNCHTLYQMRVLSFDAAQNEATLEVRKVNTPDGPSVDVSYWVVQSSLAPTCTELTEQVARLTGTWPASVAPFAIESVPVWPSVDAFENAPDNERLALAVITGGGGGFETERIWWTADPVTFTKDCTP